MKYLVFSLFFFHELLAYNLKPIKVAHNTYYVEGKKEYYSIENKGDISNTAFIITKESVILIDTGSTVDYALSLKKEIEKITNKPIIHVINTHQHPDHFLGNNAFEKANIYATEFVLNEIKNNGELYLSNMNRLIKESSYSTKVKVPNKILKNKKLILDNYELEILLFKGHTESDLVILDKNTKTLFTSDLIFNQRALATPHADIEKWISTLKKLKNLDFKTLVPGHGEVSYDKSVIDENIEYLEFLHSSLIQGIKEGLEPFEILSNEVPIKIKNYSMFKEEYERSIINLYKDYEQRY